MLKLVIVESPSKAKNINKYLGKNYLVRATYGHIFELSKESNDKLKFGIDIGGGFVPKYSLIPDKSGPIKAIMNAAKQVEEILIASDPDREGEAIAFHIAEIVKKFNVPIKRVLFKEITKKSVLESIKHPIELDSLMYRSQQARRIIDRVVGYMVSPLLGRLYGGFISAGRVQSVALKLIVDREKEIEKFVPEEYWNIFATISNVKFKYALKINKESTAQNIVSDVRNNKFNIESITCVDKELKPDPPFITSTLAAAAAGWLKFSASKTMSCAQSLYENGYITYLRTDSVRVSKEAVAECRNWLTSNNYEIPDVPNEYKTKGTAQDAHEAIRPTDVTRIPKEVFSSEDDRNLYKLIWERFVASQMMPAIFAITNVSAKCNDHIFKASGKVLKKPGWKSITSGYEEYDVEEILMPEFEVGGKHNYSKLNCEKKQTHPLSRYSERTLIKELEKRGVGRPSTYASIMEKLTKKQYVEKHDNILHPKKIGVKIIEFLENRFRFMNFNYTAFVETKLDLIASNDLSYKDMLMEFYNEFIPEYNEANKYIDNYNFGHTCQHCGSKLVLKNIYGTSLVCPKYPECSNVIRVSVHDGEIILTSKADEIYKKCTKCNSNMVKRYGPFGPYALCVNRRCSYKISIPSDKPCSKCGADTYYYKSGQVMYLRCHKCYTLDLDASYHSNPIELKDEQ